MTVFVDNGDNIDPTGYILYPYAGQTVSDVVNIQISASDNIGVAQVEVFINGNSVATDQEQPYSYEWDTYTFAEDEEHIIYATVTDHEGNSIDIPSISVTVDNDDSPENDITPPIISILTPLSSQTVSDTVSISGFATDNDEVEQVQFLIDDVLVAVSYTHLTLPTKRIV